MNGIKVEVKRGAKWWYVVVDFNDGQPPVTKGPMHEAEAKAMASELESGVPEDSGAVIRDQSADEARANLRAAVLFFSFIGAVLAATGGLVFLWSSW